MRIYPPVSIEEAESWLTEQAKQTWGVEAAEGIAKEIAAMAEAMSALSHVEPSDELEPMFP